MSVYSISLFLHIVGALGLFAALGLEWAGLTNIRRATEFDQAQGWARLLAAPRTIGGPAGLLILLTGIHMSATRWGPRGWIIVALAGMVVIAVLGAALSGRRGGAIARGLQASSKTLSPTLVRQLHDPVLTLSLRLRVALFIGVVFLMSTQPGTTGALVAMALAAVVGVAAGMPARDRERGSARVAGTEP